MIQEVTPSQQLEAAGREHQRKKQPNTFPAFADTARAMTAVAFCVHREKNPDKKAAMLSKPCLNFILLPG